MGGGVVFVAAGDPGRFTGGNRYNNRVLARLDREPFGPVQRLFLPDSPAAAIPELRHSLSALKPSLVVVDSIALAPAAALVEWITADLGATVACLMHMLPSDLLGTHGLVDLGQLFDVPGSAARGRTSGPVSLPDLERRLLSGADRVIAVSPSLGRALVNAGARPDRVVVVPPGRDGSGETVRVSDRVRTPDVRFLTVANWSPAKGIHLVVAALAQLPGPASTLDLVGDPGDASYADQVRAGIASLGLSERARVHGSRPPERLAPFYASADVFVLPSRSEGFGIVYAEALSHGLPVIATNVGPIPDLVGDAGLLVPANDSVALAAAMERLAKDPNLRFHLSQRARRRARLLPTWDQTADRFRQVTVDLLSGRPPPRARTA